VSKSEAASRFKLPKALRSPIANAGWIAAILPQAHDGETLTVAVGTNLPFLPVQYSLPYAGPRVPRGGVTRQGVVERERARARERAGDSAVDFCITEFKNCLLASASEHAGAHHRGHDELHRILLRVVHGLIQILKSQYPNIFII
jgi:hypothetical protein